MDITEGMAKQVFKDALGVDLGDFPRMPYSEAMFYYGSDKPDMRIKLEIYRVDRPDEKRKNSKSSVAQPT